MGGTDMCERADCLRLSPVSTGQSLIGFSHTRWVPKINTT